MKTSLLALCLFATVNFAQASPDLKAPEANATQAEWTAFSKALVHALHHENAGVQASALQHIAHYGQKLNVDAALFDIVRIYRNDKNENTRILALAALHQVGNAWTMDFLKRSTRFENSKRILKHTYAVINAHEF